MTETPVQMVERLRAKIARRAAKAERWSDYYDGIHPLKFASPEFSAQSGGLFEGFADNWCQVVVDSSCERLVPTGFRLSDGSIDDRAWDAWKRSEADVDIRLSLLDTLITGRSFAYVWKPDGVNTDISFKHVSEAIVEYVPGQRRKRRACMTVYQDGQYEFATLITQLNVFRFQRERAKMHAFTGSHAGQGSWGGGWEDRTVDLPVGQSAHGPNPMREVPMVELANRARLLGAPRSEIENVAPLQDATNTLWAHALTAADQVALPARAVLGMDRPTRDVLDENDEVVGEEDLPIDRFRSDRLLWLEKEGASIAQFQAADLTNLTSFIQVCVEHISAQTRTPPHYMLGQMVNIGADALAAAESGLVAKAVGYQGTFGADLREVARLEAIASGDPDRAASLAGGSVVWRDAQFRSEAQYADALTKYKAINVPDEALWERVPGVGPDEIERWKSMRDDQASAIVGGDIAELFGPKPDVPTEAP
ncbi:phage portal protein [Streptomyces sp. NBC_01180]|uniref:phage portal protein n=1 Tax=Streptomyces sp. NBC_01180 TaxID=2903763 RepID=UPI003864F09A|nr:phage portal protein [Streptomyces sp. NBC_01180]